MKKLNRKGFTLIELLAVIVIMAIILIVTVPNIIQSISDARVSSLHNLAVSTANSYNSLFSQDLVASTNNKVLDDIPEFVTSEWQCIGDVSNSDGTKSLDTILGLSEDDVMLSGTAFDDENESTDDIVGTYCSAIRVVNGKTEVLLVAANSGRFYVAQKVTYAFSTDTAGVSR